MKREMDFRFQTLLSVFMALAFSVSTAIYAQKKSASVKIGTYDSRIVTFAWSRSDYFGERLKRIGMQTDSAQKVHDTARIKEISVDAISYQHLLHQMVFSTGSAGSIMKLVRDKLPALAKSAGVIAIVSRWEINFTGASVDTVDLTSQVALLFEPRENISKMGAEIGKQEPIPLDDMTIEKEMFDGYCNRFGKK